MPTYGFPDLKIQIDGVAATLVNISPFVTSINGWSVEALTEELTAAGDTTDRWDILGFTQKSEITLEGPYDNVANGLVDATKAGLNGVTKTLQLTFDGVSATDVINVETYVKKIERNPAKGKNHTYRVTLLPTGAIT